MRTSSKPLRVVFLMQMPPPIHGVSTINARIWKEMSREPGLSPSLLEIRFVHAFSEIRRFHAIKIVRLSSLWLRLAWRCIWKRPQLVYFSFMPVGWGLLRDTLFLFLLKLFRIPRVLHLHNRGIARHASHPLRKALYRLLLNGNYLIHLSPSLVRDELEGLLLQRSRIFVLPNTAEPAPARPNPDVPRDLIHLLYLSNLMEEKGILLLLEAFEMLSAKHPRLHLHIAGADYRGMQTRIRQRLEEIHLTHRVTCYGEVSGAAKDRLWQSADLFVFPSYFREECMPLVVLEAMTYGLPIVATQVGVVEEMLEHGHCGRLVPPQNRSALHDALQELITHREVAHHLGIQARACFHRTYHPRLFSEQLREIIQQMIPHEAG